MSNQNRTQADKFTAIPTLGTPEERMAIFDQLPKRVRVWLAHRAHHDYELCSILADWNYAKHVLSPAEFVHHLEESQEKITA